jgi:hypothetical protein
MPLSHVSKVYAAKDCKLSALTADPAGGSPVYSTSIDVPGIKSVEISGDIDTKELRGDNQLLDQDAVLKNVKVKLSHAKLSLDAVGVILGGTPVDAGTTPNQTATWDLSGTSSMGVFKLEAISASADPVLGNIKFIIHKLRAASFPTLGLAEEDYAIPELELVSSPLLSNGKWLTVSINETAAVLS